MGVEKKVSDLINSKYLESIEWDGSNVWIRHHGYDKVFGASDFADGNMKSWSDMERNLLGRPGFRMSFKRIVDNHEDNHGARVSLSLSEFLGMESDISNGINAMSTFAIVFDVLARM